MGRLYRTVDLILNRSNRISKLTLLFLTCKSSSCCLLLNQYKMIKLLHTITSPTCLKFGLKLGGTGIFHNFIYAPQPWMKSSELALRDKLDFTKDPHMTKTENDPFCRNWICYQSGDLQHNMTHGTQGYWIPTASGGLVIGFQRGFE